MKRGEGYSYMSVGFRAWLCLLALSLPVVGPALAQSQSVPKSPISSEVKELAAALVSAASEEEQDLLLERRKEMINRSLLDALMALASPKVQKGEFPEAVRISQLAVRIGEKIPDRVALANALLELGLIYSRQNRLLEALDCFNKSLTIYEETSDKKGIARLSLEIGTVLRLQGRFDEALVYLNKSLAISEQSGDRRATARTLRSIGVVHRFRGNLELALEFYQKSRAIAEEFSDREALEIVLNSIGNVYQAQGSYERALECYQKAQALCEERHDTAGVSKYLYNIGAVYNFQGRYREALENFQKSIKINESQGLAANKNELASNFHSLGLLYLRQGHYDQALQYYHKSLQIREEIQDNFGTGQTMHNIGDVYKSQGLYEEALAWFQKGLALDQKMGVQEGVAACLSHIGDIYRMQGRYYVALEKLRESLQLREKTGNRLGVCGTLKHLLMLYQERGSYLEMLEVGQRIAGIAGEINAPEELWNAQDGIGRALRALGKPEEARRSFLAAIGTIESLRHEVAGGGQQQQSFLENRISPFLSMIELLVSQKEHTEALMFAERSKARVLVDALQSGRARLRDSLSQQERQAEEEQRRRSVLLNSQLTRELRRDKPDASRVAELKANIQKVRLEYEALETNLYVAHPELKVQRGESPIIKADELGALLPDAASALLEYVVTEHETYLYAITKGAVKGKAEIRVYTLPITREDLEKQTEVFRRQLAGRDLGFRASAVKLYERLLKPAAAQLRGKTNLVIAPDATLWNLPFQALMTSAKRFLIEEAAIAYAPSLTALREMMNRRKNESANPVPTTLLALGNPLLGTETINRASLTLRDGKLDPLPEAEQEVNALRRLYGVSRSKVYIGAEAREDRVKSEAGQAKILHFAAHGMLNNASPMYSHLALAPGGVNEDGLLEAWELTQLDLKADLAVLSACETARGRIGAGEGMIGLSWAMFIAGVPSIVVSQWKVESAGTRDLMVNFHRALIAQPPPAKAKATKTEALRQAALKLMKRPETSHPFYWAGFVLVGDGR